MTKVQLYIILSIFKFSDYGFLIFSLYWKYTGKNSLYSNLYIATDFWSDLKCRKDFCCMSIVLWEGEVTGYKGPKALSLDSSEEKINSKCNEYCCLPKCYLMNWSALSWNCSRSICITVFNFTLLMKIEENVMQVQKT